MPTARTRAPTGQKLSKSSKETSEPGAATANGRWYGLELHDPVLSQARDTVRSWFNGQVQHWTNGGAVTGNALVLAGGTGVGKTHIARVIQQIIGPHNTVFWSEPQLVSALWDSYNNRQTSERWILHKCRNARLLVLDDVGAAHVVSKGWLEGLYWQLFDYDPTKGRGGVLITTNLRWIDGNDMPFGERVGVRAMSRITALLGGLDPKTQRPRRWIDLFELDDWRFRLQDL